MKKVYLAFLFISFSLLPDLSFAQTTHVVTVSNFSFSPTNFTAVVGDVVRFNWVNGNHTTSSFTPPNVPTVPAGAATWDALINSANMSFDYIITVPGEYNYICRPHFTNFGMVGSFTVSAVTPVKLANFSIANAAANTSNTVRLNWKTLTEANSDYFLVQQSYDGINFIEVGTVLAAGNSNTELSYSFSITNVSPGRRFIYFRLLTVDKDKKQQLSDIILYRHQNITANDKYIRTIFPNPSTDKDHLHLIFDADHSGKVLMNIYEASGRWLSSIPFTSIEGVNQTHVPLPKMGKGIYYLQFHLNERKETYPLIIK